MSTQGSPVWYELMTTDLGKAQDFYNKVLGWSHRDSGMAHLDYRLASADGEDVAGMMLCPGPDGPPPAWLIYFGVDDCDAAVASIEKTGGKVHMPPTDIPGVGRFAMVADPQGAYFYVLKMIADSAAFDQEKFGHGGWHELMTTDVDAALRFYAQFGWTASERYDMGPAGAYQTFALGGKMIGGMMKADEGMPTAWLPYFGVANMAAAKSAITANGGTVLHGPAPVPGGDVVLQACDPQGAAFALVGPA